MSQCPPVPLQPKPPLPPSEMLPTMYDLPSENPEEPGLPDEFHDLQPQMLSATLRLSGYAKSEIFTGTDLNLYYDVRHLQWYKRPDWFLVLGVPRLYEGRDLRSSYVIWQEGVSPFVVVELLSPGTEKEDLGDRAVTPAPDPEPETPPGKWEVYEQILRVPYYIVFGRHTGELRCFRLTGGRYQEQPLDADQPRIWIPELEAGIGLWSGVFDGIDRPWLRWYDSQGWIPTDAERADRLAEQADRLAARLRELGEDPDALM